MKQKWHAHFLAHFVILSVFAGGTPLIELASCSSVTNAAKQVELPVEVPEVWLVLAQRTVVVGVA